MAKFNSNTINRRHVARPDRINRAGGEAYALSTQAALATTVLSSMVANTYYEGSEDRIARIRTMIGEVDPLFVAKLAVVARNDYGLRSVSHVMGARLASLASGTTWGAEFYAALVRRPDDMTEMTALMDGALSAAMKKGFARAFDKFDTYQLAKYKAAGKGVNLTDVMRLVHPKVTERNGEGIRGLVRGDLSQHDTWESALSSGSNKARTWARLLQENRLGYFALLRNLRNIAKDGSDSVLDLALMQLTDPERIRKSLVMPFRYQTAYTSIANSDLSWWTRRKVLAAIERACEVSLGNVPEIAGKTVVAVDCSGSMQGAPIQRAGLFAAAMARCWDCNVMTFSTGAKWYKGTYSTPMLTLANKITSNIKMAGTNFESVFNLIGDDTSYERIVVLSDMQGWAEQHWGTSLNKAFKRWRANTGRYPKIYSWDLQGYGEGKFPEKNTYLLSGFSDKVFDLMGMLETEPDALVSGIEATSFNWPP